MKTPNVVSLFALLGILLPAIITAISQQFPPDIYWWSAAVTGALGVLIKTIEVWRSQPPPAPPETPASVSFSPAPPADNPSKLTRVLWN